MTESKPLVSVSLTSSELIALVSARLLDVCPSLGLGDQIWIIEIIKEPGVIRFNVVGPA